MAKGRKGMTQPKFFQLVAWFFLPGLDFRLTNPRIGLDQDVNPPPRFNFYRGVAFISIRIENAKGLISIGLIDSPYDLHIIFAVTARYFIPCPNGFTLFLEGLKMGSLKRMGYSNGRVL